ncbi:MAG TPA: DUF1287 domain-containing protein [Chryseolinea sp.]|nr:DUF1287 domain-containing protein [Chryseolinea sp.]
MLFRIALAVLLYTYTQDSFFIKLSDAAVQLTQDRVQYDPSYFVIDYPNGDVPANKGVCTDVVIRAYRKMGTDLQEKVHEDMVRNFSIYPKDWGLKKPDKNIDHRRVPNLRTFFSRHGASLKPTSIPDDYTPGDIVTWDLGKGIAHIGIVIKERSADNIRHLVVHNIGNGQEKTDCLFTYRITGHYRYNPVRE